VVFREFQEGMKVFTQFHTAAEHEQFLQNMQREQELKLRLTELARYRTNGITRYEECMHFEQELLAQQPVVQYFILNDNNLVELGHFHCLTPNCRMTSPLVWELNMTQHRNLGYDSRNLRP